MGVSNLFFFEDQTDTIKLNLHREMAQLKNFNYSIQECYSLSVKQRQFYINEIIKRLEKEKEAIEKARNEQ